MHPRGYRRLRVPTRPLVMAVTGLALALGALPAVTGAAPGAATVIARADDSTASQNVMRNGWDPNETAMGPSVVPSFTQLFATTVSGQVYAQPLVIGSTVFVATENDWIYGLDAATGAVKWSTQLGKPWVITKSSVPKLAKCGDLVPNIGVTGTPVYNPDNGNVYFFANRLNAFGNPRFYLYGVNPADGSIVSKVLIWGYPSNDSHITFDARYEGQRTGALLLGGSVYGAFASHCDKQPYSGYVAGVNVSTNKFTLWSDESGVTYNQAGIWQSGGGLMSDGPGRIFFTSGNGVSPGKGAGTSPHGQLAESVVRIAPNATTGVLSAKDFFSPANAPALDAADTDFGAGGPVAIPFGTSTFPDLLAQDGKDGRIFLLNRDSLGGREQAPGSKDNDLFVTKSYGGQWGHPAIFGDTALTQANAGSTNTVNDFLVSVGKGDVLRVFRFGDNSSDKPVISNVGASSLTNSYTSGSPVITSNGDDPTSAVIWEVHAGSSTGLGSELDAYALGDLASDGSTPSPCTSSSQCIIAPIWHMAIPGAATKFAIPATSNGRVYIRTRGGGTGAGNDHHDPADRRQLHHHEERLDHREEGGHDRPRDRQHRRVERRDQREPVHGGPADRDPGGRHGNAPGDAASHPARRRQAARAGEVHARRPGHGGRHRVVHDGQRPGPARPGGRQRRQDRAVRQPPRAGHVPVRDRPGADRRAGGGLGAAAGRRHQRRQHHRDGALGQPPGRPVHRRQRAVNRSEDRAGPGARRAGHLRAAASRGRQQLAHDHRQPR